MTRNKVCGLYKITNTITGDFYIGSSKDVKRRWVEHKKPSVWKAQPNSPLYKDMQKYSTDKFDFQILAEVEQEHLKETEQQFIEILKPTYNNYNAKGLDVKRYKEYKKDYMKEYSKSDKYKEYKKEYDNQLCSYNGGTITLGALSERFRRAGVEHPTLEAKKYLIVS